MGRRSEVESANPAAPASPAAIDRLLRTVRPVQEPDSLAAAVGASLFRDPAAQWDYAVAYPR